MKSPFLVMPASTFCRRSAATLATLTMATTAWMLNANGSSAEALVAVDPSTPVLATGTVMGGGAPKAGVTVSLIAHPNQGALNRAGDAGLELLPVGETVSASDGSYRIWGSMDSIPADYRGASGQVDMELVFDDGGVGPTWQYSLFPVGTAEPGVTVQVLESEVASIAPDGSIGGKSLAPALAVDMGTTTVYAPGRETPEDGIIEAPEARTTGGFDPVELTDLPGVNVIESDTSELTEYASEYEGEDGAQQQRASRAAAAAAICITRYNDAYQWNKKERFVVTHGWRNAKATLIQGAEQSTTHTLGIATISPSGALSANGTASKTFGTGTTVTTPGLVDHIMHNRINYRMKVNTCGLSKWVPYSVYDYNTDPEPTYNALYQHCTLRSKGTIVTTSTYRNSTYSSGMELSGISLSAQSGYGNSVKLSYRFTEDGKFCGNLEGGPAQSSRVSSGPR